MANGRPGAPFGNTNGAKGKPLVDALRRAAAQDNWHRLRAGCNKVMDLFERGEPWAVAFVADRLDGKAMPSLPDMGDGQLVISWVVGAQPSANTVDITPQPEAIEVSDHSVSSPQAGPLVE